MARAVVCLLICAIAAPALAAKEPSAQYKKESKRALTLYAKESYKDAVAAFRKALAALGKSPNRNAELETRKFLALALYNSGKKDDAVTEYRALKAAAPGFRFDPDEVLPETITFFTNAVPEVIAEAPKPEPVVVAKPEPEKPAEPPQVGRASAPAVSPPETPASTVVVTPDSPREVKPTVVIEPPKPTKRWHWYYLTPLGIGQYLAGSPVRGTLFLLMQVGFTALNVTGYLLYSRELIYGDGTARNAKSAQLGQTMMNVGFFGIIGSALAGTIDGAFLEP